MLSLCRIQGKLRQYLVISRYSSKISCASKYCVKILCNECMFFSSKRLSQCQKGRTLYNLLTKEHGTAVDSEDISKNVLDSPNDSRFVSLHM